MSKAVLRVNYGRMTINLETRDILCEAFREDGRMPGSKSFVSSSLVMAGTNCSGPATGTPNKPRGRAALLSSASG